MSLVKMSAEVRPAQIEIEIKTPAIVAGVGAQVARGDIDVYNGGYEVTPSQETQVLQTRGHAMQQNVVVNPIPSYYGRISYNGAILTVS